MKIQKNMETKTVLMEVKLFIQFIKPIIRLRVCIANVGHQLILEQKSGRKQLFTTTYITHSLVSFLIEIKLYLPSLTNFLI